MTLLSHLYSLQSKAMAALGRSYAVLSCFLKWACAKTSIDSPVFMIVRICLRCCRFCLLGAHLDSGSAICQRKRTPSDTTTSTRLQGGFGWFWNMLNADRLKMILGSVHTKTWQKHCCCPPNWWNLGKCRDPKKVIILGCRWGCFPLTCQHHQHTSQHRW